MKRKKEMADITVKGASVVGEDDSNSNHMTLQTCCQTKLLKRVI